MATLDLLGNGYTGTLGLTHGARRNGSYYIRSHARRPAKPTDRQSSAWAACAALSRMAHTLARYAWPLLGLSDSDTTHAGAIAHFARAMIADQSFSPANWPAVVPRGDRVSIREIVSLPDTSMIAVSIAIPPRAVFPPGSMIIGWAMADDGYCGPPRITAPDNPHLDLHPPEISYGPIWICTMLISSYGRRTLRTDGDCRIVPAPIDTIDNLPAEKYISKGGQ